MATETKDATDQSIGSLVGEIVSDAQHLARQHLELFRHEVREDFQQSKHAALVMVGAHVLAVLGCICVTAMLVGLLARFVPGIPWWCWCGILGGALLLLASLVYGAGKRLLASINPLPDQTVRAVKEGLRWPKT